MQRHLMSLAFLSALIVVTAGCELANEQSILPHVQNKQEVVRLFPATVCDLEHRVNETIESARTMAKQIIDLPASARTFDAVVRKFDQVIGIIQVRLSICEFLRMVHPDAAMREAGHKGLIKIQEFYVDEVIGCRALYQALKACAQTYGAGGACHGQLTPEQQRYLDEVVSDLERNGLGLPDEQLEDVKRLNKEIALLTMQFDANISNDTSFITVTRDELAGLDEAFVESLSKDDQGRFILRSDMPTFLRVRAHCAVEKTREASWLAYLTRAYPANESVLKEICKKRHELAKVLGFRSFAHLSLDDQMAKTPEHVQGFLKDLMRRSAAPMARDFTSLRKHLPDGIVLDAEGRFKPWDLEYVFEHYKKTIFNVDNQKIAEYFPMEATIDKLLGIYEQFLGIEFRREAIEGLWHSDVQYVAVYAKNGTLKGHLIFDLFPRPNKFGHAGQLTLTPARMAGEEPCPPVIAIVANFQKSTATRPSLLSLGEVNTFFHEFGHAMHALFGATDMIGFSGTSVKKDFIEVPSQMFEEWLSDKDILKRVSSHYQTGEPLDDAMIDRIIGVKKFGMAYWVERQAGLSQYALAIFGEGAKRRALPTVQQFVDQPVSSDIVTDDRAHFECSFGHLTGYGAQYYSYLWSKVYSIDLFSAIKKEGLVNHQVGQRLITTLLGRGGSDDPDMLVQAFLGRAMSIDAFVTEMGLSA